MPRSASSIQTEIDLVDAAMAKVLAAQSYSVGGRSKQMAAYESLTKRRDMLQAQYDRATGNAPMLVRSVVKQLH